MPNDKSLTVATSRPAAIVPHSLQEIQELASVIARSGMAPKSYLRDDKKPDQGFSEEKICVGIIFGAELGFSPMMALQGIAVIGNMPAVWGDAALAKVLDSGLAESHREYFEDGPVLKRPGEQRGETVEVPNPIAVCIFKRKGRDEPIERRFSYEDAGKAQLLGKATYQQYLKRMLQMRARAWAMRDGFADVLRGLHIAEEMRDMQPDEPTPERPARPTKPKKGDAPPANAVDAEIVTQEETEETAPVATHDDTPPFDPAEWMAGFLSQLARCKTAEEISELRAFNEEEIGQLPEASQGELAGVIRDALEQFDKPKAPAVTLSTERQPVAADQNAAATAGQAGETAGSSRAGHSSPAASKQTVTFNGQTVYDTAAGAKGLARHIIEAINLTKSDAELSAVLLAHDGALTWIKSKAPGDFLATNAYAEAHRKGLKA